MVTGAGTGSLQQSCRDMSHRTRIEKNQAADLLDRWLAHHEQELDPVRPDANEAGRAVLEVLKSPVVHPRSGEHDRF